MAALIDRNILQDSTFDGSSNDSVLTQLIVTPNPEITSPTQTNPASPADSNVALVETKIDYSLNINKVLKKKIAHVNRSRLNMNIQAAVLPGEWILPPLSCFISPVANCIVNSHPMKDIVLLSIQMINTGKLLFSIPLRFRE